MDLIKKSEGYKNIFNAFVNNDSYFITDFQKNIVDEWWGSSSKISTDEIKNLTYNIYTNKWRGARKIELPPNFKAVNHAA